VTNDRTNDDIFETEIFKEVREENYQYRTDDRVLGTWYRNARRPHLRQRGHGPRQVGANRLFRIGLFRIGVSGLRLGLDGRNPGGVDLPGQDSDLGERLRVLLPHHAAPRIEDVGSVTPGVAQMLNVLNVWNKQAATIVAGSGTKSDRDDVKDKIQKGTWMVT
jgi:ribonucleoside-diphosphate reductase alpha chain